MRPWLSWLWLVCLTWGLVVPGVSRAAGFDCAKAGTRVEKMICADKDLSAYDDRLNSLFRNVLAASSAKAGLRASQRAWIKTRDACPDAACLERAYRNRIAALQKTAGAGQATNDSQRGWALRREWYKRLQWPKTCEQAYRQHGPIGPAGKYGYGVDIYNLEGTSRLAVVQCDLLAYQASFVVLLFKEGQHTPGRLLKLPDYDRDTSGKVMRMVGDDGERGGAQKFDPATRTLTFLAKGRGIGDCGSLVTYAFKDGQAIVTEARAQACFDDQSKWITDPEKWPLVEQP